MKRLTITFDEEGKAAMKTEGFTGPACLKETERILAGVGQLGVETKTTSLTKTQGFYVQTQQRATASAGSSGLL